MHLRSFFIGLMVLLVGLVNLAPVLGLFWPDRMENLYGISLDSADLELLLRHRAVLFGLLGGFMVLAAFRPRWQALAMVFALVSMVSFLILSWLVQGENEALAGIARVDAWALIPLGIAVLLMGFRKR